MGRVQVVFKEEVFHVEFLDLESKLDLLGLDLDVQAVHIHVSKT